MDKDKFNFRKKELDYCYEWLDDVTFRFEFGDGIFIDAEGDDYFIYCEYHIDTECFVFEAWFEHDVMNIEDKAEYITEAEKEYIKEIMKQIMNSD